jgi:hypothetical protein
MMTLRVRSLVASGSLLGFLFSGLLLLGGSGAGGDSAKGPSVETDEMKAQRKATEEFFATKKGHQK